MKVQPSSGHPQKFSAHPLACEAACLRAVYKVVQTCQELHAREWVEDELFNGNVGGPRLIFLAVHSTVGSSAELFLATVKLWFSGWLVNTMEARTTRTG